MFNGFSRRNTLAETSFGYENAQNFELRWVFGEMVFNPKHIISNSVSKSKSNYGTHPNCQRFEKRLSLGLGHQSEGLGLGQILEGLGRKSTSVWVSEPKVSFTSLD